MPGKPDPKKKVNGVNGVSQLDARRRFLERAMEESGAAPAATRASGSARLPDVVAPSLDGLKVKLKPVPPITEEQLLEELAELGYSTALRTPRTLGEYVGPDDELTVDTVGYCDGQLVPFSVREGQQLGPDHDQALPGLREQLIDERVGTTVTVELIVPEGHPVEALRGRKAVFSVRIVAAAELELFPPESDEFLERAESGDTLEAVLEKLAADWHDQREAEAIAVAFDELLGQLIARARVTVDDGFIEREITRRWRRLEEPLLRRLNLPQDQQQLALKGWLQNVQLRDDLERSLAGALVLRAIATKEGLATVEEARRYFDELMPELGLDPLLARVALKKDAEPEAILEAADRLIYLRVIDHIWSKATVERG